MYVETMLTLLELSDVNDRPKVKLDLPGPLRLGERIHLAFCLKRIKAGRQELLEIKGEVTVTAVGLDVSARGHRQIITVESLGSTPHWRAVKKITQNAKKLALAISPRTVLQ